MNRGTKVQNGVLSSLLIISVVMFAGGCGTTRQEAADLVAKRDYRLDPTKKFKDVNLRDVVARPSHYKGMDITFRAIFHRYENTWIPFYTKFTAEEYVSFSIWPEGTQVWDKGDRKNDVPFIFVKKTNPAIEDFLGLAEYTPVEISGTVDSDFKGFPWIEAFYISKGGRPLYSREELHHIVAGLDDATNRKYDSAAEHLTKALSLGLPSDARTTIEGELTRISELKLKGLHEVEVTKETKEPEGETVDPKETLIKQLEGDIDELNLAYLMLEEQKNELENAKLTLEESLEMSNESKIEMEGALENNKKQLEETAKENKELKEAVERLKSQLDEGAKATITELEEVRAKNTELTGKVTDLSTELNSEKDKNEELETKLSKLSDVENTLKAKDEELAKAVSKGGELDKKVAEQNETIETINKQLKSLNDELNKAKENLSSTDIEGLKETISKLELKNKELSERASQLEQENAQLMKAKDDGESGAKIRQLEDTVSSLRKEVRALQNELSKQLEESSKEIDKQ